MANVPRMLVRDDLTSGTLVAPLGLCAAPTGSCPGRRSTSAAAPMWWSWWNGYTTNCVPRNR